MDMTYHRRWTSASLELLDTMSAAHDGGATCRDLEAMAADLDRMAGALRADIAYRLARDGGVRRGVVARGDGLDEEQ